MPVLPFMKYKKLTIRKWDDLLKLYRRFQRSNRDWIFRGQSKGGDRLTTSLERIAKRFGIRFTELNDLEDSLIRHFQRKAHRYLAHVPDEKDTVEWLALMRHHGAPTRLMDWTYSFFVALHFALGKADEDCAVWALDVDWLVESAEKRFPDEIRELQQEDARLKDPRFFELLFKGGSLDLVYTLNPERLNERLIIQQGIFLTPTNLKKSFEENFSGLLNRRDARDRLWKIRIKTSVRSKKDILRNLQGMNISDATLFPGLDGFARSLNALLATPDLLKGRLPYQKKVSGRRYV